MDPFLFDPQTGFAGQLCKLGMKRIMGAFLRSGVSTDKADATTSLALELGHAELQELPVVEHRPVGNLFPGHKDAGHR